MASGLVSIWGGKPLPPPVSTVAPYLRPAVPPISIIRQVPVPLPPVSITPPVSIPGNGIVTQPITGPPQPFVVPINGHFHPSLPNVPVQPPAYQPPSSITPAVPGGVGSGGTTDPMTNLAAAYAGMFSGLGDGGGSSGGSGALPQSIVPAPATDTTTSGLNWAMVGVLLAVATLAYLWWQHRKKGKQVAP
jgi:hypothetical protein